MNHNTRHKRMGSLLKFDPMGLFMLLMILTSLVPPSFAESPDLPISDLTTTGSDGIDSCGPDLSEDGLCACDLTDDGLCENGPNPPDNTDDGSQALPPAEEDVSPDEEDNSEDEPSDEESPEEELPAEEESPEEDTIIPEDNLEDDTINIEDPGAETPESETPETEAPVDETPEAETPEAEEPETQKPEIEEQEPESEEPEREEPETEEPAPELEPEEPDVEEQEPAPEEPELEEPETEDLESEEPEPEEPELEDLELEVPEDEEQEPEDQEPEDQETEVQEPEEQAEAPKTVRSIIAQLPEYDNILWDKLIGKLSLFSSEEQTAQPQEPVGAGALSLGESPQGAPPEDVEVYEFDLSSTSTKVLSDGMQVSAKKAGDVVHITFTSDGQYIHKSVDSAEDDFYYELSTQDKPYYFHFSDGSSSQAGTSQGSNGAVQEVAAGDGVTGEEVAYSGKIEAVLNEPESLEEEYIEDGTVPVIVEMRAGAKEVDETGIINEEKFKSLSREIITKIKEGSEKTPGSQYQDTGVTELETINSIAMRVPLDQLDELGGMPSVRRVSLDRKVQALLDDSVSLINADDLWEMEDGNGDKITGEGVTVAVLDTGIDYTHPDFGGCNFEAFENGWCRVVGGYDFINDDADPMDDHGHGTHCAGIVAADGTVTGVAPGADLMAVKVLSSGGWGSQSGIISGIEYAADPNGDGDTSDHADIISMSLGGYGDPDDPLSRAVDKAVEEGILVVVAAGNSGPGSQTVGSPGVARDALTVGAMCKPAQVGADNYYCETPMAIFSSRGPTTIGAIKPDLVAPGVEICSSQWEDAWSESQCKDSDHTAISGTSMATPHVAGGAALLLQANPGLEPLQLKSIMVSTAEAIYYDHDTNENTPEIAFGANTQGTGKLDLAEAIGAEISTDPQSIGLGRFTGQEASATVAVQSLTDEPIELTISVSSVTDEDGNSYDIASADEETISLDAFESGEFTLSIDIPEDVDLYGVYTGEVSIGDYMVPFSFTKMALLEVSTEGWDGESISPGGIFILNAELNIWKGGWQDWDFSGNSVEYQVPPGTYHIYAMSDAGEDYDYLLVDTVVIDDVDDDTHSTLSLKDTVPITLQGEDFDGNDLNFFEWQMAVHLGTQNGGYGSSYSRSGSQIYGDRIVYITPYEDNGVDMDFALSYQAVQVPAYLTEDQIERGGWAWDAFETASELYFAGFTLDEVDNARILSFEETDFAEYTYHYNYPGPSPYERVGNGDKAYMYDSYTALYFWWSSQMRFAGSYWFRIGAPMERTLYLLDMDETTDWSLDHYMHLNYEGDTWYESWLYGLGQRERYKGGTIIAEAGAEKDTYFGTYPYQPPSLTLDSNVLYIGKEPGDSQGYTLSGYGGESFVWKTENDITSYYNGEEYSVEFEKPQASIACSQGDSWGVHPINLGWYGTSASINSEADECQLWVDIPSMYPAQARTIMQASWHSDETTLPQLSNFDFPQRFERGDNILLTFDAEDANSIIVYYKYDGVGYATVLKNDSSLHYASFDMSSRNLAAETGYSDLANEEEALSAHVVSYPNYIFEITDDGASALVDTIYVASESNGDESVQAGDIFYSGIYVNPEFEWEHAFGAVDELSFLCGGDVYSDFETGAYTLGGENVQALKIAAESAIFDADGHETSEIFLPLNLKSAGKNLQFELVGQMDLDNENDADVTYALKVSYPDKIFANMGTNQIDVDTLWIALDDAEGLTPGNIFFLDTAETLIPYTDTGSSSQAFSIDGLDWTLSMGLPAEGSYGTLTLAEPDRIYSSLETEEGKDWNLFILKDEGKFRKFGTSAEEGASLLEYDGTAVAFLDSDGSVDSVEGFRSLLGTTLASKSKAALSLSIPNKQEGVFYYHDGSSYQAADSMEFICGSDIELAFTARNYAADSRIDYIFSPAIMQARDLDISLGFPETVRNGQVLYAHGTVAAGETKLAYLPVDYFLDGELLSPAKTTGWPSREFEKKFIVPYDRTSDYEFEVEYGGTGSYNPTSATATIELLKDNYDMAIGDVDFSKPVLNEKMDIGATVYNVGLKKVDSVQVGLYVRKNWGTQTLEDFEDFLAFQPGASQELTLSYTPEDYGFYQACARVEITEGYDDEFNPNNDYCSQFTIGANLRPYITNLWGKEIFVDQATTVDVVVRNDYDAEDSETVTVVLKDLTTDEEIGTKEIETLTSGARKELEFAWTPTKPGEHELSVEVSTSNEAYPEDNTGNEYVFVYADAPDLVVEVERIGYLLAGEDNAIDITIGNIGKGAGAGTLTWYIGPVEEYEAIFEYDVATKVTIGDTKYTLTPTQTEDGIDLTVKIGGNSMTYSIADGGVQKIDGDLQVFLRSSSIFSDSPHMIFFRPDESSESFDEIEPEDFSVLVLDGIELEEIRHHLIVVEVESEDDTDTSNNNDYEHFMVFANAPDLKVELDVDEPLILDEESRIFYSIINAGGVTAQDIALTVTVQAPNGDTETLLDEMIEEMGVGEYDKSDALSITPTQEGTYTVEISATIDNDYDDSDNTQSASVEAYGAILTQVFRITDYFGRRTHANLELDTKPGMEYFDNFYIGYENIKIETEAELPGVEHGDKIDIMLIDIPGTHEEQEPEVETTTVALASVIIDTTEDAVEDEGEEATSNNKAQVTVQRGNSIGSNLISQGTTESVNDVSVSVESIDILLNDGEPADVQGAASVDIEEFELRVEENALVAGDATISLIAVLGSSGEPIPSSDIGDSPDTGGESGTNKALIRVERQGTSATKLILAGDTEKVNGVAINVADIDPEYQGDSAVGKATITVEGHEIKTEIVPAYEQGARINLGPVMLAEDEGEKDTAEITVRRATTTRIMVVKEDSEETINGVDLKIHDIQSLDGGVTVEGNVSLDVKSYPMYTTGRVLLLDAASVSLESVLSMGSGPDKAAISVEWHETKETKMIAVGDTEIVNGVQIKVSAVGLVAEPAPDEPSPVPLSGPLSEEEPAPAVGMAVIDVIEHTIVTERGGGDSITGSPSQPVLIEDEEELDVPAKEGGGSGGSSSNFIAAIFFDSTILKESMETIFHEYGRMEQDDHIFYSTYAVDPSWEGDYEEASVFFVGNLDSLRAFNPGDVTIYICDEWDFEEEKCTTGFVETDANKFRVYDGETSYFVAEAGSVAAFALGEPLPPKLKLKMSTDTDFYLYGQDDAEVSVELSVKGKPTDGSVFALPLLDKKVVLFPKVDPDNAYNTVYDGVKYFLTENNDYFADIEDGAKVGLKVQYQDENHGYVPMDTDAYTLVKKNSKMIILRTEETDRDFDLYIERYALDYLLESSSKAQFKSNLGKVILKNLVGLDMIGYSTTTGFENGGGQLGGEMDYSYKGYLEFANQMTGLTALDESTTIGQYSKNIPLTQRGDTIIRAYATKDGYRDGSADVKISVGTIIDTAVISPVADSTVEDTKVLLEVSTSEAAICRYTWEQCQGEGDSEVCSAPHFPKGRLMRETGGESHSDWFERLDDESRYTVSFQCDNIGGRGTAEVSFDVIFPDLEIDVSEIESPVTVSPILVEATTNRPTACRYSEKVCQLPAGQGEDPAPTCTSSGMAGGWADDVKKSEFSLYHSALVTVTPSTEHTVAFHCVDMQGNEADNSVTFTGANEITEITHIPEMSEISIAPVIGMVKEKVDISAEVAGPTVDDVYAVIRPNPDGISGSESKEYSDLEISGDSYSFDLKPKVKGRYTVTYYAVDEMGNMFANSRNFLVGYPHLPEPTSNTKSDTDFKLMIDGETVFSGSSGAGSSIPGGIFDMKFEVGSKHSVLLNEVDMENEFLLPYLDNAPEIASGPSSFSIKDSFAFEPQLTYSSEDKPSVCFDYDGVVDPGNAEMYKCDWDFENEICTSPWLKLTNLEIDKEAGTVCARVDSFSAFVLGVAESDGGDNNNNGGGGSPGGSFASMSVSDKDEEEDEEDKASLLPKRNLDRQISRLTAELSEVEVLFSGLDQEAIAPSELLRLIGLISDIKKDISDIGTLVETDYSAAKDKVSATEEKIEALRNLVDGFAPAETAVTAEAALETAPTGLAVFGLSTRSLIALLAVVMVLSSLAIMALRSKAGKE